MIIKYHYCNVHVHVLKTQNNTNNVWQYILYIIAPPANTPAATQHEQQTKLNYTITIPFGTLWNPLVMSHSYGKSTNYI